MTNQEQRLREEDHSSQQPCGYVFGVLYLEAGSTLIGPRVASDPKTFPVYRCFSAGKEERLQAENERLREYYEAAEEMSEVGLFNASQEMWNRLEAARATLKGNQP